MYHLMYQDHLAEPQTQMGPGKGPVSPPTTPLCPAAVSLPVSGAGLGRAGLGPLGVA